VAEVQEVLTELAARRRGSGTSRLVGRLRPT
jgi:hypothetical protein